MTPMAFLMAWLFFHLAGLREPGDRSWVLAWGPWSQILGREKVWGEHSGAARGDPWGLLGSYAGFSALTLNHACLIKGLESLLSSLLKK